MAVQQEDIYERARLSRDPRFDIRTTREFMDAQDCLSVWEVPH